MSFSLHRAGIRLGAAGHGNLCAVLVSVGGIVTISYAAHAAAGMEVVGQRAILRIVITGNGTDAQ